MRKTKKISAILLSAVLLASGLLTSCNSPSGDGSLGTKDANVGGIITDANGETVVIEAGDAGSSATLETMPSVDTASEPVSGTHVASSGDSTVSFTEGGIKLTGNGVTASEAPNTVNITAQGTYVIEGTLDDGQIVIDTQDSEKVKLILNGVSLSCSTGPAIYVKSAPKKVILYTADGSVNILSDGNSYVVPDEEQVEGEVYPNACVYSCEDLKLDGEGTLYINGNADKGVNIKDDLEICGGTVVVRSAGVGIRGNDSITVEGGNITITSGADGIKTANTDDGKGVFNILGGKMYISSIGDGISSSSGLYFTNGTAVIATKDAVQSSISAESNVGVQDLRAKSAAYYDELRGPGGMPPGGGMGGMPGGGMMEGNSNKSTISAKGLKAVGELVISGGSITVTSEDDGIHSDDIVKINGGSIYLEATDDGIHADNYLFINSGTLEIAKSYEGIEAHSITINGGTNRITASDDGTNANGGTSSMGGGMRPWAGSATESSADDSSIIPTLTVNGGYTIIDASGDGLDSNSMIYMTGGTVIVYGPTNSGNGAIDYGDSQSDSFTISGGTLLAVGAAGMAQAAQNDGQAVLAAAMRSSLSEGTVIGILDGDTLIAAFKLPKSMSSIVYSSPALTAGKEYTVVYGGTYSDATSDIDGILIGGNYSGYSELGKLEAY